MRLEDFCYELVSPMMIMKAHETMRMVVSGCMMAILPLPPSCCSDVVGGGRNVDAVVGWWKRS